MARPLSVWKKFVRPPIQSSSILFIPVALGPDATCARAPCDSVIQDRRLHGRLYLIHPQTAVGNASKVQRKGGLTLNAESHAAARRKNEVR